MPDAALKTAEDAVVGMVASAYMGKATEEPVAAEEIPVDKELVFDFESEFQTKIAAFAIRDKEFLRHCLHLLLLLPTYSLAHRVSALYFLFSQP